MYNPSRNDRIRLDFDADVPDDARCAIVDAITGIVNKAGLYAYGHENRTIDAWAIEITAHDRSEIHYRAMPDADVFAILKETAHAKGISIEALIAAASEK